MGRGGDRRNAAVGVRGGTGVEERHGAKVTVQVGSKGETLKRDPHEGEIWEALALAVAG